MLTPPNISSELLKHDDFPVHGICNRVSDAAFGDPPLVAPLIPSLWLHMSLYILWTPTLCACMMLGSCWAMREWPFPRGPKSWKTSRSPSGIEIFKRDWIGNGPNTVSGSTVSKHRTQWVLLGSLSSGGWAQWVPFGLLFVCQSELTEFFAELTEFAPKLSQAQWVLFSETVLSKQYSARFLLKTNDIFQARLKFSSEPPTKPLFLWTILKAGIEISSEIEVFKRKLEIFQAFKRDWFFFKIRALWVAYAFLPWGPKAH